MDSVPVLFISGQAKTETLIGASGLRTRGVQEVDIIPMVAPITKFALQIKNVLVCLPVLNTMIDDCLTGRRGPCWLSIPLDAQGAEK
jgi:acetolactate synthase-1/2/3 large subunit